MNRQEHNQSWKVWNPMHTTFYESGLYHLLAVELPKGIQFMTGIK